MKLIKVLGTGCTKCEQLADTIAEIAKQENVDVEVVKEKDLLEIMKYKVVSSPSVVIDDQVVHSGSVPGADQIRNWLTK